MINIKSNFEIIGQTEEISFTTKIFESQNKKEYRKKLQEKENIYKTLSFKSFTEKELNFLENLSIEAIDKQCLLTIKESNLAFNYINNQNAPLYLEIKFLNGEILEKYDFNNIIVNNYITNTFNYLKIYDLEKSEYFKISQKDIVTINNKKYFRFYVIRQDLINNVAYNFLRNNYNAVDTKVCFLNKVEIQSKNLDIKENFKKFGETKIKFKIIDEVGGIY